MSQDTKYLDTKYLNTESCAVITNKWVLAMSPMIEPAPKNEPYHVFDEKKSGVMIKYSLIGGKQQQFRISLPQFKALNDAVEYAQINSAREKQLWNEGKKNGMFYWSLADACGDDQLVRIFGEKDEDGKTFARQLIIERKRIQTNAKGEEEFVRLPWTVSIITGRGVRVVLKNGAAYMKGGTFEKETQGIAKLSDGSMRKLMYYSNVVIDNFENAAKGNIMRGYNEIKTQFNS